MLKENIARAMGPLDIPAWVLCGDHDGYWFGKGPKEMEMTIRKYLPQAELTLVNASHLWVNTPQHLERFLSSVPFEPLSKLRYA
jgi:hypothetical protein